MKKTLKSLTALLLALIMTASMTCGALAEDYSSKISSIMTSYTLGDIRASSAPQQAANGLYRCVEMLELIARQLNGGYRK